MQQPPRGLPMCRFPDSAGPIPMKSAAGRTPQRDVRPSSAGASAIQGPNGKLLEISNLGGTQPCPCRASSHRDVEKIVQHLRKF
jgi:hypothetical protein